MKRKVPIVNCLSIMYMIIFIKRLSIFIGHNMLTIIIHTNINLVRNYQTKYIDIILRTLKTFLIFDIPDICFYTVNVVI